MDKAERQRLRELCEKATAGPLYAHDFAAFSTAARTALPALLDALDAAEARAKDLSDHVADMEAAYGKGYTPEKMRSMKERIAELEAKRLDVHCAFCGEHMANISEETANLRMAEHIVTCEKHPLRAAANRVAELEEGKKNLRYTNKQLLATLAEAEARIEDLNVRLLSAAGDDLCRLSQEEIKAMNAGTVKIPPREEFLASCARFHEQVAAEAGVMTNCLTLAQLVAENQQQANKIAELEAELADCEKG